MLRGSSPVNTKESRVSYPSYTPVDAPQSPGMPSSIANPNEWAKIHDLLPELGAPDRLYLNYTPTSSADFPSYTDYIEQLDFKTETHPKVHTALMDQVKGHVDFSCHKYLRQFDNKPAFKTMVTEFLTEHGQTFWDQTQRSHLKQLDISKGFWYPRDTERNDSR
jgi:hypothetical protein